MFWADALLENQKGKQWVNDAWTPSGIVHMGSLKGPVIHDVLFKILKSQGKDVKFTFGFDEMDAVDGLPEGLKEKLGEYMGIPVSRTPSPVGEGTFAEYYSDMMLDAFKKLDVQAEIYLASDYYKKGIYDKAMRYVLDNVGKIRKVYAEMYKKEISDTWFPVQVVCPNCGKVGTTKVTGWDGEKVTFECSKTLVKWAEGCGESGTISPFGGNATMTFKVEWAAKWWTFGVTIEGAGKDHASSGGTYDIARKLTKDVFGQDPPLWLPYEFFLYDGKKMSSSKGLGLTAEQLMEVIPPQMVRFLMIKTDPNTAVEFNPFGTQIIPKLYEDYLKASQEYEAKAGTDMARAFELSQIGKVELMPDFRFLTLAQWVQMPSMKEEIEKAGLLKWAKYAKVWVEKYAPESDKFAVLETLPAAAKDLTELQKKYLGQLSEKLDVPDAEAFQLEIYNIAKGIDLPSKDAFQAIYTALLGKDHGPKAAWLILSLDKDFVKKRFTEV